MNTHRIIFTLTFLFAVSATPVAAHHDVLAVYDPGREFTVTGKVVQIAWLNPHVVLAVDVKAADGKVVTWQVELAPPNALTRKGFQKDTVPVSSSVTVKMWPARDGSHLATVRMLTLPNGAELEAQDALGWRQNP